MGDRLRPVLTRLAVVLCAVSFVNARPLTMRRAERAIDLAWEAELAGDTTGARSALVALVQTSTLAMGSSGRSRVGAWLAGIDRRKQAFDGHGRTPLGYRLAFETLRDFGEARSERLWELALRGIPSLDAVVAGRTTVELRVDRVRDLGSNGARFRDDLASLLARRGVVVLPNGSGARIRVEVDADASPVEGRSHGFIVTASGSAVMKDADAGREIFSAFSKRFSERRSNEASARRVAVRRLLDDIAARVAFSVREKALDLSVVQGGASFDTRSGLGSN